MGKKYVIKAMCEYTDQQGNTKNYYRIIGSASYFSNNNGSGFILNFDAYPASGKAMVVEKEEWQGNRGGGRSQNGNNRSQNEYNNQGGNNEPPF